VACAACAIHVAAHAQTADKADAFDSLNRLSRSIQLLASRVAPAVVQIQVTRFGPAEDTGRYQTSMVLSRQQSIGSGVIVDPDGYIMTNAHVVQGAQRIRVTVPTDPGIPNQASSPREASVVGVFKEADLALLKIAATGLPFLRFANYAELRQGHVVFAFGSPAGLDNSMSMGVVSAVARQLDQDGAMVFIQTDAAINPGNSGGALVNTAGELVGIDTFIFSQSGGNEGVGFAVPSTLVRAAFEQLRKYGHMHRPEIGVAVQTITPPLAAALHLSRDAGVVVSDIAPGGPAAIAGVKLQDIIVALNGTRIDSVPAFLGGFLQHSGTDPIRLRVIRGPDEEVSFTIPPIVKDHDADRVAELPDAARSLIPRLGVLGIDVNQDTLGRLGSLRLKYGVLVAARAEDLRGLDTGLQAGDVIHEINGKTIADVGALRSATEALRAGEAVALQVERNGSLIYVAFEME
jgi:serine protease Do